MKWFLLILFLIPLVSAQGIEFIESPNTDVTLFLNCIENNVLALSTANITIYYPNSSIFINTTPANSYDVGQFIYNFTTPSVLGTYEVLVECLFTSSSNIAQSTGGFQVKEGVGVTLLATSVFILGLIAILLYYANREFKAGGLHYLLGVFLYIMALWVSPFITFILRYMWEGTNLFGLFQSMFLVHIILVIATTILFFILVVSDVICMTLYGKNTMQMIKQNDR